MLVVQLPKRSMWMMEPVASVAGERGRRMGDWAGLVKSDNGIPEASIPATGAKRSRPWKVWLEWLGHQVISWIWGVAFGVGRSAEADPREDPDSPEHFQA